MRARGATGRMPERVISLQAPPDCEQVCRSHPIEFAVPILADDREVFARRLYLGTRKLKLGFSEPDEIGNANGSVLQFIKDVAANPSAIGNTTHDAALHCCALRPRFCFGRRYRDTSGAGPADRRCSLALSSRSATVEWAFGIAQPTLSNSSKVASGRLAGIGLSEWGTFTGAAAFLALMRASIRNQSALRAKAALCGGGTVMSTAELANTAAICQHCSGVRSIGE